MQMESKVTYVGFYCKQTCYSTVQLSEIDKHKKAWIFFPVSLGYNSLPSSSQCDFEKDNDDKLCARPLYNFKAYFISRKTDIELVSDQLMVSRIEIVSYGNVLVLQWQKNGWAGQIGQTNVIRLQEGEKGWIIFHIKWSCLVE